MKSYVDLRPNKALCFGKMQSKVFVSNGCYIIAY